MAEIAHVAIDEEVKAYRIHVSPRYLDLTKQKLELTRLPHEGTTPKSEDWWEPKAEAESLIDYWLEKYSWKDQEEHFNATIPQFRTSIVIPGSETPLRLHFVHVVSPHVHAIPLLLIPPFPFASLSFAQVMKPLTEADDQKQPFHLIIPSLPGLAYSDPLPTNVSPIATVAEMLNTLMARLGYAHYLVTNAGAAQASPANIDYRLARRLATAFPDSCLGTHFIAPPLEAPKATEAPWEWAKWTVAKFFGAGILGYSNDDFAALKRTHSGAPNSSASTVTATTTKNRTKQDSKLPKELRAHAAMGIGLNSIVLGEPNTLAYALCDSPTGLLISVLKALRTIGPRAKFTEAQIITFAQLAWVPGPEYALRFWARCAAYPKEEEEGSWAAKTASRPKVMMTVFGGEDQTDNIAPSSAANDVQLQALPLLREGQEKYACPAWGRTRYDILSVQRVSGKPGLVAWERSEVIIDGVRALSAHMIRLGLGGKLMPSSAGAGLAPLDRVVVSDETKQDGSGPVTKPPEHLNYKKRDSIRLATVEEKHGEKDGLDRSTPEEAPTKSGEALFVAEGKGKEKVAAEGKGKEKEQPDPELLSPPPPIGDPLFSGSSPDTLVNTPPLDLK